MTRAAAKIPDFHDLEPELEEFEAAVLAGLGGQPKTLPCKFFYDQEGSRLFDRICELDEYYPTRTETALLDRRADEIAELIGEGCHVIEFGSGSSVKTRILLAALRAPVACTAVDISREHLLASVGQLADDFPEVEIVAVCADYTRPFEVPAPRSRPAAKRIGFFPGSTIGNFTRDEASAFLSTAAGIVDGGDMLIGVDLKKDPAILNAAYDDAQGVTAAFNLNLLARVNRELGGNFDLDLFYHRAHYNADEGRVEMHLVSARRQRVDVAGRIFAFDAGETIHTENSYKYSVDEFQALARGAGFEPLHAWNDSADLFSIHYLGADT